MIGVWQTSHEISRTIASAIHNALPNSILLETRDTSPKLIEDCTCHIGYGILRGMEDVFPECDRIKKPWFNVDNGYFKPNHYDGYYRVSFKNTQQTLGLNQLTPRFDRLLNLNVITDEKKKMELTR